VFEELLVAILAQGGVCWRSLLVPLLFESQTLFARSAGHTDVSRIQITVTDDPDLFEQLELLVYQFEQRAAKVPRNA
jgi:hypothetical protein